MPGMENVLIHHRLLGPEASTEHGPEYSSSSRAPRGPQIQTHRYPFPQLGPFTSHIQPHFAIYNAGQKLQKMGDEMLTLIPQARSSPDMPPSDLGYLLFQCRELFNKWTAEPAPPQSYGSSGGPSGPSGPSGSSGPSRGPPGRHSDRYVGRTLQQAQPPSPQAGLGSPFAERRSSRTRRNRIGSNHGCHDMDLDDPDPSHNDYVRACSGANNRDNTPDMDYDLDDHQCTNSSSSSNDEHVPRKRRKSVSYEWQIKAWASYGLREAERRGGWETNVFNKPTVSPDLLAL